SDVCSSDLDPTRLAGVRPYQQGDPLNRIHWRATARTGELHSRIYETSRVAGATFLLDFHAQSFQGPGGYTSAELALTIASPIRLPMTGCDPCEWRRERAMKSSDKSSKRWRVWNIRMDWNFLKCWRPQFRKFPAMPPSCPCCEGSRPPRPPRSAHSSVAVFS